MVQIGNLRLSRSQCGDPLWQRDIDEIYYLWKLAGGDCMATLKQNPKHASQMSSIHRASKLFTVSDSCEHGETIDTETIFDDTIMEISLAQMRTRLEQISRELFYPLIESQLLLSAGGAQHSLPEAASQLQPLNIRESDIEYQLGRVVLFGRLLAAYPYKKDALYRECRVDIPPLYRALAWATLLDVASCVDEAFDRVDKDEFTSTDRQIDVDIPRCHQYDSLMASPEAHYRLKRVLKAWFLSNPNLVYWQGLDSLCAPFLWLNFNNEALAFACLDKFVNKYAAKFFLKDNSEVIQEYLAVFAHTIAFHDAELANHFEEIEFRPDLYAIPWFLTMFAHIFPLNKILHLWDTLLLGSAAFPLCIGVAILRQLRSILMASEFNECILLFSELPEINIGKCVADSIDVFCATPVSCLYRYHATMEPVHGADEHMEMGPLTLDEMKAQMCPGISGRDVVELSGVAKLLIVDIRPPGEFTSVFSAKNVPYEMINFGRLAAMLKTGSQQSLAQNESDATVQLFNLLQTHRNAVKIVATSVSRRREAVDVANNLVKLNFSKICILHKGVECLARAL